MSELLIRKATAEDAENMITYLNMVGGESDNLLHGLSEFRVPVERVRSFIEAMNSSEKSIVLVGVIDGMIVSRAVLETYGNRRIAHRGSLSISVKQEYWHQGIATKMISEVIDFARRADLKVIEPEVLTENENAVSLYKKMGFEIMGTYQKFYCINGDYKDAYYMNLYL